jgi:hypothetical protein
VKKTNEENLLAGSISGVPAGVTSSPSLISGNEPPAMLLALLNSPLETMLNSQQAKIMGTGMTKRGQVTVIMFYGVVPTANGKKLIPVPTEATQ